MSDHTDIPYELADALGSAREAYDAAVLAKQQGAGTTFEVTAARRDLALARDNVMHARRVARTRVTVAA